MIQTIEYKKPEALYLGVTYSPDGKHVYASAGNNNKIRVYDVEGQRLTEKAAIALPAVDASGSKVNFFPGGLNISPDGRFLYVANNLNDSMSIIDTQTNKVTKTVAVGHNPYAVTVSKDGAYAYVSNWGGNTISVVDTATGEVAKSIQVGTHPSAMKLSGQELYVTNSDSDSISIINTKTNQVKQTISLAPYKGAQEGSSPNALAVSPDGKSLYVANAGNNDVVVIDTKKGKIEGMIPTGWYPTGLEISKDGKQLYVANAKGFGAGPNPNGPKPYSTTPTPADQYSGSMIKGTLSIIDVPREGQLEKYTKQVIENNGFNERDKVRVSGNTARQVIPRRVGDSSPIKHVIYIVKENRTYDQVFGSLGKGNGDPSLNLFGDETAPNHRQLARQFATIDNFFADAEVSADGWNWSTAAMANTYVQKNWPTNYGGRGHDYDFEGGNLSTAPSANPENAYLWDALDQKNIDYRNYGFFVSGGKVASTEPKLAAKTDLAFPGFDMNIKDQFRADEWLKEFKTFEGQGKMPSFQFLRLPVDHTSGTKVGQPTPKAMVADNDLALGRIVEAVSNSEFWKDTAIFVVEDDAQNGSDHVDAHRTVALAISPYTQTGKVDSTFYTTSSMLRTMELIMGIAPMTQFDASATPMVNSFTDKPNFAPYKVLTPKQPLDELNQKNAPMAAESAKMNLASEDKAPEQQLNQAIWRSVKGAESEMPAPKSNFRDLKKSSSAETAEDAGTAHFKW
ncbi:bifunctional YncE family protein/alkaline phosphatase family protein [Aneurinibacillus tyrosinisolvens]|uniref:bifunctional YncE family protein/alkaline phosphatase family protein n=1 Tax=Aneurinibacillus tyrosinisolvens TaxID=1443435 RepID=UPI000AF252D8|nr:bifunctional YncE family protein/alkaline phosphatase family protein [Aneurinibacillus tyrosinisolvens]